MPKVGMRMFKTAFAVFLCFMIYLVRKDGIPFYSAISAVLCMQPDFKNSKLQAKNRMIATLVGGILGMLVLCIIQQWTWLQEDFIHYFIISIMMIPMLYIPVVLNKPQSSYISCVVFMSITVSHVQDANPFLFGTNRIFDTLIGIIVALVVNAISIPRRMNHQILCKLDLALCTDEKGNMKSYEKYHMHRLLQKGAHIVMESSLHPENVSAIVKDLEMYCLACDGILIYNSKTNEISTKSEIKKEIWHNIYENLKTINIHPFVYQVKDDVLYTHYDKLETEMMYQFYMENKGKSLYCFQYHEHSVTSELHSNIIFLEFFISLSELEKIKTVLKTYSNISFMQEQYQTDYVRIRIYNEDVMSKNLQYLQENMHVSKVCHIANDIDKQKVITTIYRELRTK